MSVGRDFVVMGTDGLFDNLYDEDIVDQVTPEDRMTALNYYFDDIEEALMID